MRWIGVAGIVLGVVACVPDPNAIDGFDSYNLTTARGTPATFACTTGPDSRQRANAALAVFDAGMASLSQDILQRTEADTAGGAEFNSRDLRLMSEDVGLRLAEQVDQEFGCYFFG